MTLTLPPNPNSTLTLTLPLARLDEERKDLGALRHPRPRARLLEPAAARTARGRRRRERLERG